MFSSKLLHKIIATFILLAFGFTLSIALVNFPKIATAMQTLEEKNAKEMLHSITQETQIAIKGLKTLRQTQLERHQQNLKDVTQIVYSLLTHYNTLYQKGGLTLKEAKRRAFTEIINFHYGEEGYFFLIDDKANVLVHPNKKLIGKNIIQLQKERGHCVAKKMLNTLHHQNEVFASYDWEKPNHQVSKKLSYIKTFKPWHLNIGTGIFLDDIETLIKKQKQLLTQHLLTHIQEHQIGANGYTFVFNDAGVMLTHPNKDLINTDITTLKNPRTGNRLFDDLVVAAHTTQVLHYYWDKPEDRGNYLYEKTSWISYLPELGWYIASSSYNDDFDQTAHVLQTNLFSFGLIAISILTIFAVMFFRHLLLPLTQLTKMAEGITKGDYTARTEVHTFDEIGDLAKSFNIMADTTQKTITSLDSKVNSLKELNTNFRFILDSIQEAIIISDENYIILDANKIAIELFAKGDKAVLIGKCILDYIPEYEHQKLQKAIQSGLDKLENYDLFNCDYELFPALASGKNTYYDGQKVRISVILDLSDFKRQEQQLLQQSRMAQMGEMISMIAHQWRQPLSAISSTSINLQLKLELNDFDLDSKEGLNETREYFIHSLEKINTFVQDLSTTINDFRHFYKPDKQKVSTTIETVVTKSLNIIKASLQNDNIKIIEEYQNHDKVKLHDSEMMHVVLNILKNAQDNFRERTSQNPYIKITIKERFFSICDNGGGIPDDILDKIFEPYFSTKNERNGTGLGLYMSKTIVHEHHNGILSVKNTEDGVCFAIQL